MAGFGHVIFLALLSCSALTDIQTKGAEEATAVAAHEANSALLPPGPMTIATSNRILPCFSGSWKMVSDTC